ncbi:hypothetical protein H6P81_011447 [Aristolochia fimbriata]|uniref:Uncharacterized protein n=1 Tax=Aristolochia fimbriata TaxID=158543 RepID=A0AAV7EV18_ARIFI|nr:hypothetical protein H6P81_011447 [Aristolochia fimbriata]
MAITTVDSAGGLSAESIPVVDLRFLSQSELNVLSLCSVDAFDPRRTDDLVIPKIDRSVFNESAGSRKQTYSRLRLAPRPSDSSPVARRRRRLLPEPAAAIPSDPALDTEKNENKRIVQFLRDLFDRRNPGSAPAGSAPAGSDTVSNEHTFNANGSTGASTSTAMVLYDGAQNATTSNAFEPGNVEICNKRGVVVDLAALENNKDLFGDELRRRTSGLATEAELLEFLRSLNGAWGSRRKKRKVVDAEEFGEDLPRGWKVLLGLKRKEGRVWLYCRRYVSPSGQQLASGKDVASYLRPFIRLQDDKQSISCHVDENSGAASVVADQNAPVDPPQKDGITREVPICYAAVPISSIATNPGQQVVLFRVENPAKAQLRNLLECRKCNLTFGDKDSYVQHLLSVHQRNAKRTRLGKSVGDGVIMNGGKYECQFCHKIFEERRRYNGHVGIHVRNYGKSLEEIPDEIFVQTSIDPSVLAVMPPMVVPQMVPGIGTPLNVFSENNSISAPVASTSNHVNVVTNLSKQDTCDNDVAESAKHASLETSPEMLETKCVETDDNAMDTDPDLSNIEPAVFPTHEKEICHAMSEEKFRVAVEDSNNLMDEDLKPNLNASADSNHEMTGSNYGDNVELMANAAGVNPNPFWSGVTTIPVKEEKCLELAGDKSGNIVEISNSTRSVDPNPLNVGTASQVIQETNGHNEFDGYSIPDKHFSKELEFDEANKSGDMLNGADECDIIQDETEQTGNMCEERERSLNVVEEAEKSVNVLEETEKSVNVLEETEKSVNVLEETEINRNVLDEMEKSVNVIDEMEKPDNVFDEARKSEIVFDEVEKSGNVVGNCLDSCLTSFPEQLGCVETQNFIKPSVDNFERSYLSEKEVDGIDIGLGLGSSFTGLEKAKDTVAEVIEGVNGENLLKNVVTNDATPLVQPADCFSTIVLQNKAQDEFAGVGQRLESMSGFEELRLEDIGPSKFGFEAGQDSSSLPGPTLDLACGTELGQELDSSVQFEWEADMRKMVEPQQLTTICVWCRVEFKHEGINLESQSDSVGFMCPTCKAKISGQLTILDGGLPM